MKTFKLTFFLLLFAIAFTGCQQDDDDNNNVAEADADAAALALEGYLQAQAAFATAYEQVDQQARQEGDLNGFQQEEPTSQPRSNDCVTATFTPDPDTFFPAVLNLDYGDNCTDENGSLLGGRIIATFNGLLLSEGTQIDIAFENFQLNEYVLSGNYVVQNDGLDEQGRQSFSSQISGGELFQNGQRIFTYEQTANRYQVAGQSTNFFTDGLAGILDDVSEEIVTANGTGAFGNTFSFVTESPLVDPITCFWRTQGRLNYTIDFLPVPAILDFGDGNCDNNASLTIGQYTYPINL